MCYAFTSDKQQNVPNNKLAIRVHIIYYDYTMANMICKMNFFTNRNTKLIISFVCVYVFVNKPEISDNQQNHQSNSKKYKY